MSKLIVEVCRISKVEDHPYADRMKIATVKGWQTCIKYDPETGESQFNEGDLCIYFPPDSVLPKSLYDDRLKAGAYLKELPKRLDGSRPESKRVAAVRLRNMPSFGLITKIDPEWGDDPNWPEGTDLASHFGVLKYEQPVAGSNGGFVQGDAESPHNRFFAYTSIEHYANYPDAIPEGTDVVITEKIHGMNSRVGLVLDTDEFGNAEWKWMAGSHSVRRKQFVFSETQFRVDDLIERKIISQIPNLDEIFLNSETGKYWKVTGIIPANVDNEKSVSRIKVILVTKDGDPISKRSDFWEPLSVNMKSMLEDIMQNFVAFEKPYSIMVYGEIFGNVQDMKYGFNDSKSYRAFDVSINNRFLDFDVQMQYFQKYNIEVVPILYRGPFSVTKLRELTSGPTTVCDPEMAGTFKGREGVVIKPTKENYSTSINGRCILKSVSVDYLARKGGTEYQ